MSIPRPEYPRPQCVRSDWLCLNGPWQFEMDPGDSGLARGLLERPLEGEIVVPFAPEAPLSGVGHTDFIPAAWYRREVAIPETWAGRRVLLHFQAVDYDAAVWANGTLVGRHRGGFTPFTCDLSDVARPGEIATVVVRARDDARASKPRGKQCPDYANRGCLYTRTTGIWQTVWLEPVPATSLGRPHVTPDLAARRFLVDVPVAGPRSGLKLRATLSDADGALASAETAAVASMRPMVELAAPEGRVRPWDLDDPHLYGLDLALVDAEGGVVDRVESYAGLRSVAVDGRAVLLNGRPVFQRLVLDQGYYPDGVMTAPSDAALVRDIELAKEAGFNGGRLHQKVFEERFLAHADRLGYLVWGEFGDWGAFAGDRTAGHEPTAALMAQWAEILARDFSHPSIIGWCPLNESPHVPLTDEVTVLDDVTRGLVAMTHAADPTRPVVDASGWIHRAPAADVYDMHDYDQDPAALAARFAPLAEGRPPEDRNAKRASGSVPWRGQPYFVSEFGGTWWQPGVAEDAESWGYGERPRTPEEFYARFEGLTGALLENPGLFGYCYTQLTDVYQEQNGIYTFDRGAKFDPARLRAAQSRKAAIEESGA